MAIRHRVERALQSGDACWCPVVRLELWKGANSEHDRQVLRDFERSLPELPINAEVWDAAYNLARRARFTGVSVPMAKLLIAACARHHRADLIHTDADFVSLDRI